MSHDRSAVALARLVVYGGALLFVVSLLTFAVWYLSPSLSGADAGPWTATTGWPPSLFNAALFSAFALHHSLFARTGLKAWIGRLVTETFERSVYVWIASLAFLAVVLAWQPVPGQLWSTSGPLSGALYAIQVSGAVLSVRAAARINGLALAGIPQALGSEGHATPPLTRTGIYGVVRHPIYLGWILMVWATPVMTGTRLVFAAISTLYLIAAVPFEERDLHRSFGPAYADYARQVRWRMIPWVY